MNFDMMKMLIGKLEEQGFYEMIFVLLMVHRKAHFMENVNDLLLSKMITGSWEGTSMTPEQIIGEYKNLLT